jgi:hypothetical protein
MLERFCIEEEEFLFYKRAMLLVALQIIAALALKLTILGS